MPLFQKLHASKLPVDRAYKSITAWLQCCMQCYIELVQIYQQLHAHQSCCQDTAAAMSCCMLCLVRHNTTIHLDSGAVGALYGPLHGGANEAVLRMLERIGTVENIPKFIEGVKNRKEKMFGFGHRCAPFVRCPVLSAYFFALHCTASRHTGLDTALTSSKQVQHYVLLQSACLEHCSLLKSRWLQWHSRLVCNHKLLSRVNSRGCVSCVTDFSSKACFWR